MRIFLALALLSMTLGGCPQLMTRSDISEKENQRQVQTQVSNIQQSKAEQDNKLLSIQDELRTLNGRLSSIEHKLAQAPQGPTNQDLIEQMKIFETQIASLKAELEEAKAKGAQINAAAAAASANAPINKELKSTGGEKGNESWEQGEEHFTKKDWKNAILSYQNYRDQNPKGKNYSMATYKIGVSFQELKMKDEARAFYEEVMQKFPKTPTAKKAKFRLGQLK